MAGRSQSRRKRQALYLARTQAARHYDRRPLNIDPIRALQEVLDRSVEMLRVAESHASALDVNELFVDTMVGRIPNEWVRLEADLRKEVGDLAINMERNGLAERMVSIEEAKAAMMVQALVAAADEVGIPRDQVKKLGPALRAQLRALGGGSSVEGAIAA